MKERRNRIETSELQALWEPKKLGRMTVMHGILLFAWKPLLIGLLTLEETTSVTSASRNG